ncbi:unnamed protein product [Soboliphyme baturini]|uniref:Transposase n=1 Tax=Soboliphyme baturini TaxID=241478 RepID=A0A183IDV1_9BILA|nr:unnamed protein product [Soboliphyme baturini]
MVDNGTNHHPPNVDLYDVAFENHGFRQESISMTNDEKNLLEQQIKEKDNLLKKLTRNFYSLLVTARAQIKDLETKIAQYTAASAVGFRCPHCKTIVDRKDCKPVHPVYTRVLKSQLVIETKFSTYEELTEWVVQHGLTRNADNMPTLPESLQAEMSRSRAYTLTNTGSTLVRP